MKNKLFVISLLILSACTTYPEIHRNDVFLLTKGFYKGCTFTVLQESMDGDLRCPEKDGGGIVWAVHITKDNLFNANGAIKI